MRKGMRHSRGILEPWSELMGIVSREVETKGLMLYLEAIVLGRDDPHGLGAANVQPMNSRTPRFPLPPALEAPDWAGHGRRARHEGMSAGGRSEWEPSM